MRVSLVASRDARTSPELMAIPTRSNPGKSRSGSSPVSRFGGGACRAASPSSTHGPTRSPTGPRTSPARSSQARPRRSGAISRTGLRRVGATDGHRMRAGLAQPVWGASSTSPDRCLGSRVARTGNDLADRARSDRAGPFRWPTAYLAEYPSRFRESRSRVNDSGATPSAAATAGRTSLSVGSVLGNPSRSLT